MDLPSSSSSPSLDLASIPHLLGGSGGGGGCSRAIDRHNPIITDEKRSIRTPPNSAHPSPFTPKPSPLHQQKQTPKSSPISTATSNARRLIGLTKTNDQRLQVHAFKKGAAKLSDLATISASEGACTASKASLNYIDNTPPESSRYLLDEGEDLESGFVDVSTSDFDPVLKLMVPCDQPKRSSPSATASHEVTKPKLLDGSKSSAKPPLPPPPPPPPSSSNHQEVVLRVSLHCRGCEGKVRKQISRMQGVTSFNIDFAAKKVTVVGDVTPLQVITSISKVKNTKLLTPATSTGSIDSHGS